MAYRSVDDVDSVINVEYRSGIMRPEFGISLDLGCVTLAIASQPTLASCPYKKIKNQYGVLVRCWIKYEMAKNSFAIGFHEWIIGLLVNTLIYIYVPTSRKL